MRLNSTTKNSLALVLCILGLVGLVYSLWNILILSDPKMIPSLVVSMISIIGSYAFLIKDNAIYPKSVSTILYFILILGLFFWGIANAYFLSNMRDTNYFLLVSIFILAIFFAGIFRILWMKRVK